MLASTIPNCVSYDPTFAYEVVVIIRDGIRRMFEEQQDVYFYVTLMNENYQHPAMPEGAAEGIIKGMYLLRDGGKAQGAARSADGIGDDPARSDGWRRPAARRLEGAERHLERDELQRAAPRRNERRSLQPAASRREAAHELRRDAIARSCRPGRRVDRLHAQLRRPDCVRTSRVASSRSAPMASDAATTGPACAGSSRSIATTSRSPP